MEYSLLRDRMAPAEGKVTFVELFFDLVFVFAVTQLSHLLVEHLDVQGAIHTALLLTAVWIVWVYTTWATNWLDTRHPLVRLMLFGLMAAGLLLSTSIPDAMGERGLTFALAYVALQNGRNAFTLWCIGKRHLPSLRNFQRIQFWLLAAGVLWILGAFYDGNVRLALWAAALFLEVGSPWWLFWTPGMGFSTIEDWQVSPHHFAERCGLFVIIALGESIIVTGATFARLDWNLLNAAAFAVALAGSIAIWWVYFATTADQASEEFASAERTGGLARAAYTYSHLPIVAGIILTAVGDELVLAHPTGHVETAALIVLIGGPALFLTGSAIFNRLICGDWPRSHVIGTILLAGCIALAPFAAPLVISGATTAALAVVGAMETRRAKRNPRHTPHA
jgi:low temperature requirement protein LtrA